MSDPNDRFAEELASGELEALTDALSALLPAEAPSPAGRAALLGATERVHRFEELVAPVAEAADLSEDAVAALLRSIDDPARWAAGPAPGIELLHFEGGPKTARAITGFVRVAPGGAFPEHGHAGAERVVVLQGAFRDSRTGEVHGRGAILDAGPEEEHAVEVVSPIPLVYLAVVQEGVRIGGELIAYDDPRA